MDFSQIKLSSNLPYPKLSQTQDATSVFILKNLISARAGVLTCQLQYLFQSAIADKSMEELAQLFEEASILKNTHLTLLTNAIVDFGGVPVFEDAQKMPFTSSYINYATKLKDMLNANIRLQTAVIDNISNACKITKNQQLQALLNRIMEDDNKLLSAFKQILTTVQFLSV